MKKLFYLFVSLTLFVGCAPIDDVNNTNCVHVEGTQIIVDYQDWPCCMYYEFTYKGHTYISSSDNKVFIHSPSCPCHNNSNLFNGNSQASGLSLY